MHCGRIGQQEDGGVSWILTTQTMRKDHVLTEREDLLTETLALRTMNVPKP